MILSRLHRARRMTFEESRWRMRELAHTVVDRVRSRFRTPDWDRKDVADVLGHRSLQSTGIYAKLNVEALAAVALPWMGEAS